MSVWGRLGLIQAAIADAESTKRLDNYKNQEADKNSSLEAVAEVLGYETKKISTDNKPKEPNNNPKTAKKLETTVEQPEPSNGEVPPAQFVVVKSKTIYHQETDKPKELSGPTLTDWNNNKTAEQKEKDKNATLYFGLPSVLMPSARYLPLLHNVLGKFNKTHKLDTKTIIRKTAAGKFLTQLPKQHLQQWPKNLLVVVDNSRALEPYWYDFELIIAALKKLLGNSVISIAFDKDSIRSNHTPWCRYSNWPGRGEDFKFEYFADNNPFAQADAILLLSDLGALKPYASHHLSEFINAKIPSAQRKSKQFLTLSPVVLNQKSASFLNPVAMVDTVKLPRFPKSTHNPPTKKLNQEVKTLLAAVAYLPVFDAALLRKLRTELNLGGSYLDGVIWNHEHVSGNQVGKLIDSEHQENYRAIFQTQFCQDQKEKIWSVVKQHFAQAVEGLHQLVALQEFQSNGKPREILALKEESSPLKYFEALAASYDQQGESSTNVLLKAQCKTAFETLSENIDDTTYQLLAAAAYKDDIQNGRWPEELPLSLKPKLAYLYGKNIPKIEKGLCYIEVSRRKNSIVICEFDENFSESLGVFETLEYYLDGIIEVSFSRAGGSDKNEKSLDLQAKKISVKGRKVFTIPEGCEINIDSGLERLTLNLVSRKFNFSDNSIGKMGYKKNKDNKLIYLNKNPKFFSESYAAVWKKTDIYGNRSASNEHQHWHWRYAEPIETINYDDYGTYLDLNLFGITQRFRWINPGTFQMGSPESEAGRFHGDTQHQVTLTQGFWLADTTCTQALWQAVMGNNPSHFKGENKPVETISWLDAQAFIEKLTETYPGIGFRLPTEAEWEYACRAGTLTPFSFGEELTLKQANYRGTWEFEGDPDKNALKQTCDVTDFPPNPWGLYQMHGNVWEWCNDWYVEGLSARSVTDPTGPEEGALCVVRGGSWFNLGRILRSATRYRYQLVDRFDYLGLRLSLSRPLKPI